MGKIIDHDDLMGLLYSKVNYTRLFLQHVHKHGAQSEKTDIAWLDTLVRVRVAMAISPFHKNVVADLDAIARPRARTRGFPVQFADLHSQSDFERTYKPFDGGGKYTFQPPAIVRKLTLPLQMSTYLTLSQNIFLKLVLQQVSYLCHLIVIFS